jgi:hypothetical protein
MQTITQKSKQETAAGTCTGDLGDNQPFIAGLVDLSVKTFLPPHGVAHVMFARQRAQAPDYTTKELTLSFTKGQPNGPYPVTKESSTVRLTFADNSDPDNPVIYNQKQGTAELMFDAQSGVFSGTLTDVVVENVVNDTVKTLTINVTFSARENASVKKRAAALRSQAA